MDLGPLAKYRYQWSAVLVLLVAVLATGAAYQPGLGGSLHFDDVPNLQDLEWVEGSSSAVAFITSGKAGPTGRPLALASFVPQAYAWPHAPDTFLRTNIRLHLLNGVLLVWLLYLLTLARTDTTHHRAAWVAAVSGMVWMLLPILASSSLLIVQRMTTLSATFVLAGFIGYLYGRRMLERRPRLALIVMGISIVAGAAMASLVKENGALLPLLILAAEAILLPRPGRGEIRLLWRAWCVVFLLVPAAALSAYLLLRLPYSESTVLVRGFSGADRLLTQAHVLWQYLHNAFLPTPSALGPFQDDQVLHTDWLRPLSLLAVTTLGLAVAAGMALRRRAPLFSFAVTWYLAGHALESSTIPLELYFEHRNYIPLIGPVYAIVAASMQVAASWQLAVRVSWFAYASVLAGVLLHTTTLWGQPMLAAEMWAIYKPDSKRATQYLAQQLQTAGDHGTARQVLRRYSESQPSTFIDLQLLIVSCGVEPEDRLADRLGAFSERLKEPRFEHGVVESLRGLYRIARRERCGPISQEAVYTLASVAASNPAYRSQRIARHNLHVLMAEEAFAQRNLDLTMYHVESALAAHYATTTLILAVQTLYSAGLWEAADSFVAEAQRHKPRNPIQAAAWRRHIGGLQRAMKEYHDH